MTIQNAFDIISKQLQKNEQNIELLDFLQEAVDLYELMQEDDVTYTLPEVKSTMGLLDNLCVRYENADEEYDYSNAKEYKLGKGYDKE
jgi:hypothetical protein